VSVGRAIIDAAETTGSPSPSAASRETAFGPAGLSRTRSADAPVACNRTSRQANGNPISSPAPAAAIRTCSAASSNAGWIANPSWVSPAGNSTSAYKSWPSRQAACRPRNIGPYSYPRAAMTS